MIITVTPNPSLDRTYEVPTLERGAVLRSTADRIDPGGKGVNVSRAVAAAGQHTLAVLPLGGPAGAALAGLLREEGIEVAGVPVAGQTRSNIAVAEPDGTLTKINAAGPELTADESEALLATVGERSAGADWIACCGSLPRGLAPEWYAELVARAHRAGARIALDTSGPSLTAALRERPDVVKPNAQELAGAVGRPLTTLGDAVAAAEELRSRGARAVLASLGADGQLLVDADGARFGSAPVAAVRSNVGAGDASLAGFLAAGGSGAPALAAAVAHGAAAVQLPGSLMPTPSDLAPGRVTVTADVPLDRPLTEPVPAPWPSTPVPPLLLPADPAPSGALPPRPLSPRPHRPSGGAARKGARDE
ncbi:1-phosphofructokinase [Streptomyces sp. NPDC056149]|uniref:1-phosphofructokinase n=1 Tax=Streptomyces sp. NPDC056149 TaxID=3345728 RepID=UPI0035E28094